jgi:death-on-curing protein
LPAEGEPGEGGQGRAARTRFLTLDEVLAIHASVLRAAGGAAGVRDLGLLESALFRPRTGHYAGLPAMAAALCESLLRNHAFVDGNKRVAVVATDVFLRLNGWRLRLPPGPTHAFLMRLFARGHADFEHLLPWIRKAMRPLND